MDRRETFLKDQIIKYCSRMDQMGFVANHDGNISVKFDQQLLSTPTAEAKFNITGDMILTLSPSGKKLKGAGKPFSEIALHVACYNARDEINAVIHAHPTYASARGLVGKDFTPSLPEAIVSLGDRIPVTPFAMPRDAQNELIIHQTLSKVDAFMMKGNGVIAVGKTLEEAYLRLELVEHLIKMDFVAQKMGISYSLKQSDINQLLEKRAKAGLGPQNYSSSLPPAPDQENKQVIKDIIREEIKRALTD
ncbi:MAG: class II aldolase/adducin family protein [Bdellovibrionales bacterium]|nr:class II aldolase/adducin family protein [Bdellovibrionales bacterium]